jgi:hypothetical protein
MQIEGSALPKKDFHQIKLSFLSSLNLQEKQENNPIILSKLSQKEYKRT